MLGAMKSNIPERGISPLIRRNWEQADAHLPVIRHVLLSQAIHVLSVKVASPEDDLEHATDLVLIVTGGEIAVRVRGSDYHRYRDFTLRSRLRSGNKTELEKIREGWGRWYLYCWSDGCRGLKDWILVDLDTLRASGLLIELEKRQEVPNKGGKSWFAFLKIPELADCVVAEAEGPLSRKSLAFELLESDIKPHQVSQMTGWPLAIVRKWTNTKDHKAISVVR